MTVSRSSREAIFVVVAPGPAPSTAPWDLQLRGPLDPAALEHVLGELTAGEPAGTVPRHRLLRHGPDHHTLRFTAPRGAAAATAVGRIADLLTEPRRADHPLAPAQYALLTPAAGHGYEAVFIETAAPLDAAAVREALHAVLTAHPQLRSRLDPAADRPTGQPMAAGGAAGRTGTTAGTGAGTTAGTGAGTGAVHRPEAADGYGPAAGTADRTGAEAGAGTAAGVGTADRAGTADGVGTAAGAADRAGAVAAAGGGQDPLVEGEFSDEAGFAAAVASVGRTLDAYLGVQLRALLARDRRPAGPRADRLAVVVHELAVDAASWKILLDDLAAALGAAAPAAPARAPYAPDGLADWVTGLRELARDPAEVRHWTSVAGRRSRSLGSRRSARVTRPGGRAGIVSADTQDTAPGKTLHTGPAQDPRQGVVQDFAHGPGQGVVQDFAHGPGQGPAQDPGQGPAQDPGQGVAQDFAHGPGQGPAQDPGQGVVQGPAHGPAQGCALSFALDEDVTERITQGLAQRLALTAGQLLTGVFALALARWQGVDDISLDVRSDPRPGHQGLRRHVGRLTDLHPVHLTLEPGLDPLGQLAALAGPLAAAAGHATGGAGFGACREWSPDPLLRDALRELAPAQVCLHLHAPGELLPASVHPVHPVRGSAQHRPGRTAHPLEAHAQIAGGRLHIGLERAHDLTEGITATSVAALADLLRDLLTQLADASTAPIPSLFKATPQQAALFTGGDARPGTGRHVEQLVWVWHGPLDPERFTAAWQSVFDCEAVLRTAFTGGPEPQLMVHSRVTPDITRRIHRGDDWQPLLERDRLRGFDLRCPGALRLTLLETEHTAPDGTTPPTRIVLTYHRALLDTWSAHILLREFYRAYLAGGTLPGGERRPDLRDYTAWIAAQDLEPVRVFWARSAPPDTAASRPGRPAGGATRLTGVGRARLRLDPAETIRLARWAGLWGIAESSALQAVWAILIHRASDAAGPAPVCFAVSVAGRAIPLDGVARMPGPLRNALPVTVEVDPAGTLTDLMRRLRDHALDMAAYEWVPADRIRSRDRHGPGTDPAGTVIVFEDPPHPVEGLEDELAAQGIRAEFSGTVPARSVLPIGLLAHHDNAGGLVLTGVHDRDVLDEEAAAELLVQSALLLRELPLWAAESTTVAEVLKLLQGRAVPRMADAVAAGRDTVLVTLRAAGQEQAGTICLVPPPGAAATCYDLLPHTYAGPQELLVLTAGAGGEDAGPALAARAAGLPLLLAGFSGAGALACDIARRIAADGGRPPRVVLAGAFEDERARALALARALRDAAPDG
ncbi:condensation domain-containing protein [Streptomyces sp. NPDC059755]|uniref:condensation domain-containing protein n=1 Tax=Streptomyces sp. NPDC059755 TaxID=3346934 RepID=UPI0036623AF7